MSCRSEWLEGEWDIVVTSALQLPGSMELSASGGPYFCCTLTWPIVYFVATADYPQETLLNVCVPICLSTTDQLVSATLSKPLIWLPVVVV